MAALYFAGMAAIVGWALPQAVPAGGHDGRASSTPDAGVSDATGGLSIPEKMPGSARIRVNCAECGVVESVRTIHRRDEIVAGCAAGDGEEARIPGRLINVDGRGEVPSLADTIAGVIFGDRGAKKFRLTARHQIVVRLRDGSRHVFDEETPRSLRVGERIRVIAGATETNG